MKIEATWIAQAGSQELFLRCPLREVCYSGTRGPGKTDALLMSFAQHCGKGYGAWWRGVIFRREYKHLDDLVSKSKRWFNRLKDKPKFLGSKDTYKWVWPSGEELLFRAFSTPDDYWSYHGHEYPFIGWEELTGWPSGECYESMMSCNRTSRPGGLPLQVRSTTNPYGVGHNWVKAYFIDPAPYGVPVANEQGQLRVCLFGSVRENKYIDPEYIKTLESLTDENKRKAWLYGSWDITSGGMFDDVWDASRHVVEPFDIPQSWRIDRSFDWGSSKPFSVGWWAESDGTEVVLRDNTKRVFPRGSIFRISEWYGWNGKANEGLRQSDSETAKGIKQRETDLGIANRVRPGPADSSIFDEVNGDSPAKIQERHGVRWEKADKSPGSRKRGWQVIRERLEAAKSPRPEQPGFYVFSTCRQFIRTFPVLPRSEKDPDDIDTDAEDHIADETRYRALAVKRTTTVSALHV